MNEYLVEWALLREQNYLQKCIALPLERKICQQYTTEYGRVDFAHKVKNDGFLITELETKIDNKAKLSYCIEQVKQYQNIRFNTSDEHQVAILFASQTSDSYKRNLKEFSESFSVLLYEYDLSIAATLYEKEIEKSLLNSGAPIASPVAMNLTHLSSFNRIFFEFQQTKKDKLNKSAFKTEFPVINSGKSESVFNVIVAGASYFDLLTKENDTLILTDYGKRFRDNLNEVEFSKSGRRIQLSIEQRRILIESLLNGNFYEKKSKINLYYFLKFVSLTEGEWIPRNRNLNDKAKLEFINSFLKMNYSEGTVCDLLCFTCNHCEELGLVDRIKTNGQFDRAVFTSLGSRVLNYLEMDINFKREKIQIPLQL